LHEIDVKGRSSLDTIASSTIRGGRLLTCNELIKGGRYDIISALKSWDEPADPGSFRLDECGIKMIMRRGNHEKAGLP
jgi:hypothetical protein